VNLEFGFPAGAWLGAAGAAVVAAYLIRRRARRRVVPFLPLWRAVAAEARGGWGARVQRAMDLLLVLLAVGAVAFAAALPQRPGRPATLRDLVLVLDGGVSLRAGDRLDRLRQVGAAEVRRRAEGATIVVVGVTDEGPAVLATRSKTEALAAVRAHGAGWTEPAAGEAVDLARAAARRLRAPDLVFATHRAGGRPPGFRLRPVAEPAPNAGVADVALLTDPEGGGLVARLTLRGAGTVSVGARWTGPVNGTRVVTLPLEERGRTTLRVRTDGDVFSPDDAVYLLLPETAPPRVLVVADGEPSPFLAAAMQALGRTGLVRTPLGRTTPDRATDAAAHYDVLLFDRCAPARPAPGLRALYLDPPPDGVPFRLGSRQPAPVLFGEPEDHPLLRGFDPTRYPPLHARGVFGGTPVLRSAAGPALAEGPGWVALGFDPDACVLAASPAYPLFLRNAIRRLAPAASGDGDDAEFLRLGDPAPFRGTARVGGRSVRVGERLLGPPGFWERGERAWAVNLLRPGLSLEPPSAPADPLPDVGRPAVAPRPWVREAAAAAVALLALAWWVFWRNRAQ